MTSFEDLQQAESAAKAAAERRKAEMKRECAGCGNCECKSDHSAARTLDASPPSGTVSRTIYLCGPINGRSDSDCKDWRKRAKDRWDGSVIDPMRRDFRGRELEPGIAAEIVAGDIEDIENSDAILVYFDKPSVGTSMEVFYAKHVLGKYVSLIDASDGPLSPWLIHHCDAISKHLSVALACIDMAIGRTAR